MRLIDADALINDIQTEWDGGEIQNAIWIWIRGVVRDQPTIPAPRWVRCEEEMPKEMKVVVTYGKGRVSFGYCMFLYDADMEKDVCEWVDTHSNRMEVTHWMPLPEPPKEDA